LFAVLGCGTQLRPEQKAGTVSYAWIGIVFASIKLELGGFAKSAKNFHKVNASCGAP